MPAGLSAAMRRALVACADRPRRQDCQAPLDRTMLALEARDLVEWRFVGNEIEWTVNAAGLRQIGRNPAPMAVEIF